MILKSLSMREITVEFLPYKCLTILSATLQHLRRSQPFRVRCTTLYSRSSQPSLFAKCVHRSIKSISSRKSKLFLNTRMDPFSKDDIKLRLQMSCWPFLWPEFFVVSFLWKSSFLPFFTVAKEKTFLPESYLEMLMSIFLSYGCSKRYLLRCFRNFQIAS